MSTRIGAGFARINLGRSSCPPHHQTPGSSEVRTSRSREVPEGRRQGPPAHRRGGWAWRSPSSRRRSSWSCSTRPSSTSPCRTSRPRSAFLAPTWNGSSTRSRWRSAGCCCSAADPATYWGAAGSSSSASCCSRWPRWPAGSPPTRRGCSPRGSCGASAAPTALSLIAVTFPEGKPRNRAMGVYAAMSVSGAAVGLIAGGLLVQYADWRWVLFVNVPIGLVVAALATRVLPESARRRGNFDFPGAITGSLGLGLLVYGLSNAATSQNGVSHWGDTKVITSLVAAVVLLVAFGVIEARSKHALVPMRVLRSRDRTGAYLISLCVGTALFGMFFFLTIFVQEVWGYSPLRTGIAYLPMVVTIMVASGIASQLVARIGARPLMLAGSLIATGGLFWLSRLNEQSHYVSGLMGPMMVTALGMGLIFVPLSLVALAKVADSDAGVASSLLNTGQQVGGSIGLAILGTVAWSAVSNSIRSQTAAAAAAAKHASAHLSAAQQAAAVKAVTDHAISVGFAKGYEVSAGIALLALIITIVAIRVKRSDLAGINPMAAPVD